MSNSHDKPSRVTVTISGVSSNDGLRTEQEIGGWTVEMYWSVEDDIQGGPTKVVIRPTDDERVPVGGVSSTILRKVDFRTGAAQAREAIAAEGHTDDEPESDKPPQVAMPLLKALLDTEGVTDAYLVLLSTEYLARVARGQQKPVDHIAEELGRSLGTVKNHLWRARNDGFLQGGSAGRKGGYVPPEAAQIALDWLDQAVDAPRKTVEVETPELLRVIEEKPVKPKRRRPLKAIAPRTET